MSASLSDPPTIFNPLLFKADGNFKILVVNYQKAKICWFYPDYYQRTEIFFKNKSESIEIFIAKNQMSCY